jgi:Cu2+-containing amine oxidase
MFCARLDFALDDREGGKGLQVVEHEVVALPPDALANPAANAFKVGPRLSITLFLISTSHVCGRVVCR